MHAVSAGHVPKNVPRTRTGRTVTPGSQGPGYEGLGDVGGPVELLQLLHHRAFPVIELRVLDGRGDVRREGDQRGQVALWPCVRAAVDSTRWPTTLSAADRGTPSAAPSRCRAAAQTSGSFERSSTTTMSSPVIACRRSSRTSIAPAVAPGRAQVAPAVFSRRRTTATSAPAPVRLRRRHLSGRRPARSRF